MIKLVINGTKTLDTVTSILERVNDEGALNLTISLDDNRDLLELQELFTGIETLEAIKIADDKTTVMSSTFFNEYKVFDRAERRISESAYDYVNINLLRQ